jgi:prolyl oligopeptidase
MYLDMVVCIHLNIEGGHGGAADNKQRASMSTLAHTFIHQRLFA